MGFTSNKSITLSRGGIKYYKDGTLIEEKTEGIKSLRLLYRSFFGPLFRFFLRRKLLARIFAAWKKSSYSRKEIAPFIKRHSINVSEFVSPVSSFSSFNDFFIRKLDMKKRSCDRDSNALVSPCDGKALVIENISEEHGFFIKDQPFSLVKLFSGSGTYAPYKGATMYLFRLAPYDYHRYHFPLDCTPTSWERIAGPLESVNPVVYSAGVQPLTHNERHMYFLESSHHPTIAFFSIGAMFVGAIHETYEAEKKYQKGDEMGYFSFGGSSLIMLVQRGRFDARSDLIRNSMHGYETAVKVGETIGTFSKQSKG